MVAQSLLKQIAPHVSIRQLLVRAEPIRNDPAPASNETPRGSQDVSCYFFDFDDNVMFLPTPILLRNKKTKRSKKVSTNEFAGIRMLLGQAGPWKDFEIFEDTYSYFRDSPAGKLKAGRRQYFLEDIEKAIAQPGTAWQAPSWRLFVYACEKQRPMAIVTARGHSRKTFQNGIRLLADEGLIAREPNYVAVYPVGHPEVAGELIDSLEDVKEQQRIRESKDNTSDLKPHRHWQCRRDGAKGLRRGTRPSFRHVGR